ncbi:myomegalin isoform X2 [Poecilia reticulata]|uniref:myomegalin isoform X2 n=1 Tax=Poecilia reticulata TaxID=8081 RepID=UPI0007EA37DD|nr:PREDICTED: myomegalin isoform X2 [Poecilia reticulata]
MSGFLYRGRHGAAERPARPRSLGPMMDFSCDETGKGPPVQMRSLREFEQHLNDLKKENFSLKLRIYFLEEKIQQKFDQSGDGVHRANIELKVEVESLKKDLQEKQELLDRALSTAEVLSDQNEAELQRRLLERQDEVRHKLDMLEDKVQLLQKEAEAARSEARRMASLADAEAQRCLALQREMLEKMEEHGTSPTDADRLIEDLVQQKQSLSLQVEELQVKVHDLSSSSLENRERGAELHSATWPHGGATVTVQPFIGDFCSFWSGASSFIHMIFGCGVTHPVCHRGSSCSSPSPPRSESSGSAPSAAGSAVNQNQNRNREDSDPAGGKPGFIFLVMGRFKGAAHPFP